MRVVVAGAGPGGLYAAHGLVRAGADVEVLEARDGIGDFGQGYRINVNAAGTAPCGPVCRRSSSGPASPRCTGRTIADAVTRYHAEMRVTAGEGLKRSASYPTIRSTREPSHA